MGMKNYLTDQNHWLPLHTRLQGMVAGANPKQGVKPLRVSAYRSVIRMRSHFHKPIGTWLRLTLSR
jgi:hypothetical protein